MIFLVGDWWSWRVCICQLFHIARFVVQLVFVMMFQASFPIQLEEDDEARRMAGMKS